jgi:hypothetical protein
VAARHHPRHSSYDQLAGSVQLMDTVRAQLGATDAGAQWAKELSAAITQLNGGREPTGYWYDMRGGRRPEERVLSISTPVGGPGSALVQTAVAPTMIGMLQERLLLRALGCTILSAWQAQWARSASQAYCSRTLPAHRALPLGADKLVATRRASCHGASRSPIKRG